MPKLRYVWEKKEVEFFSFLFLWQEKVIRVKGKKLYLKKLRIQKKNDGKR